MEDELDDVARALEGGVLSKRRRTSKSRRLLPLLLVLAVVMTFMASIAIPAITTNVAAQPASTLLDPNTIPKWVNQITGPPPVYVPTKGIDNKTGQMTDYYQVTAAQECQQILPPGFPKTTVFGYGGIAKDAVTGQNLGFVLSSPGPTFEATRGTPINVEYINNLTSPEFLAVDPTIHWANPNGMTTPTAPFNPFPPGYAQAQSPIPMSVHLHGGEVQSTSDGGPDAWFTANGIHGPGYSTYLPAPANAIWDHYPNTQQTTVMFYHDHALGMTRINVYSGLTGFYALSDPNDPVAKLLPSGKYAVPLAIQDRSFNTDGSLSFPTSGGVPNIHPYWSSQSLGNTIMVNGKVWPNMNVDQGQYRFDLLDGSNARFYNLSFEVQGTGQTLPFTIIGIEGGYLQKPVTTDSTLIAPAQRRGVLVDFSCLAPGTKVIMKNNAAAPFPVGPAPDANTTGQVIQFTVQDHKGFCPRTLPACLNPTLECSDFPTLNDPTTIRNLTLYEVTDPATGNAAMITLNGQMWDAPVSETPKLNTTEEWVIINLTPTAHPIHIHLIQFQVESREDFDVQNYTANWLSANADLGPPPWNATPNTFSPDQYLVPGTLTGPHPEERGWTDTFIAYPGQVSKILVRFTDQTGAPFTFDATKGPGYVWHCHIIDHEDNEMMRPMKVVN